VATIEQVRDAMRHAPFTLRLVDGRSFTIKHRDFISVPPFPQGRAITIHGEDKHVHQIDVLLVQSVDYPDPDAAPPPESNGD
jgi:hypothetical protein